MKTKLLILRVLAVVAALFFCLSCEKDNQLVGTTWECKAENTKVSFTSNDSGYFYWSENGADYEMTGVIDGNVMHFGGKALTLDYVKL